MAGLLRNLAGARGTAQWQQHGAHVLVGLLEIASLYRRAPLDSLRQFLGAGLPLLTEIPSLCNSALVRTLGVLTDHTAWCAMK